MANPGAPGSSMANSSIANVRLPRAAGFSLRDARIAVASPTFVSSRRLKPAAQDREHPLYVAPDAINDRKLLPLLPHLRDYRSGTQRLVVAARLPA